MKRVGDSIGFSCPGWLLAGLGSHLPIASQGLRLLAQVEYFVESCPQAGFEDVEVADHVRVDVQADAAGAVVGDHRDHGGDPGTRAERVQASHPGAGQVHRMPHPGDVGRLDVGHVRHPGGELDDRRCREPASAGATRSRNPMAGSARAVMTNSRMISMRARGSASPTGAANLAPANRLPPIGSSLVRSETGIPIGIRSTGMPWCSW